MTEQFRVLSAEELAGMTPGAVLEYIKAVQDYTASLAGLATQVRQKQTVEAREGLQAEIRAANAFPVLDQTLLQRIKDSGASGFTVIYNLEDGSPTPSVIYPAVGKTRVRKTGGDQGTGEKQKIVQRPLSETYITNTTPEERDADTATAQADAARRMANNPELKEAKALGDCLYAVKVARLRSKHVEGY